MPSIFSKILNGELPGHFVWKDRVCFAIMTIQPIRAGHLIVIPNEEVNHWDDMPPATAAHVMQVAQKIAKAGMKVFAADGVTIQQFNETAGGQVVFHLHVHVIPRRDGEPMKPPASIKEDASVLSDQALKLAAALRG